MQNTSLYQFTRKSIAARSENLSIKSKAVQGQPIFMGEFFNILFKLQISLLTESF